jgi:hypothetical protein
MQIEAAVAELERGERAILALVNGIDVERAHWKPDARTWSIVEVVNHLYDEERDDFRMRIDILLHAPAKEWPPIDPERWCVERRYNARDLAESIERFSAERRRSIDWLRTLGSPDWDLARPHRVGGKLSAGDLLLSWLMHDVLHARQLLRILYLQGSETWKPYSGAYAGRW